MDIYPQQRYEMLQVPEGGLRLPPQLRPPPRHGEPPRGACGGGRRRRGCCGGCCLRCLCCCGCFLLLFLIAIGATGVYLYYAYKPQPPRYSIKSLAMSAFDYDGGDLTLHTRLAATVSADNPNDMIGIIYGKGSEVRVMYRDAKLCTGKLPSFYQGYRNKTVMRVVMEGRKELDDGLQEALIRNQKRRRIPLDVYLRVPVALKLGEVEVRQVIVNARCSLVVDSLSPERKIGIKSAVYEVSVDF